MIKQLSIKAQLKYDLTKKEYNMFLNRKSLMLLAGSVNLFVGLFLIRIATRTLQDGMASEQSLPLLTFFKQLLSSEGTAVIAMLCLASVIGLLKGHFVLSKTVRRNVERITRLPNRAPLYQIFPKPFYFLIALMAAMGYLLRTQGTPPDIIFTVYVAIGLALSYSSLVSFRAAKNLRSVIGSSS